MQEHGDSSRIDPHSDEWLRLRLNCSTSPSGEVTYKARGSKGQRLKEQIVLKLDQNGKLQYSTTKVANTAVTQFKQSVEKSVSESKSRRASLESMPMVEIRRQYSNISGLSDAENRELSGVLSPGDTMDPASRIGDDGALQVQADHFQEALDETSVLAEQADKEGRNEEFIDLTEREIGLREARDRTLEQRRLEETAEAQK